MISRKQLLFTFLFLQLILISCSKKLTSMDADKITLKAAVFPEKFETKIDGKPTKLFILKNKNGIEITFTNFGQRIVSLVVPDKNGKFEDIVFGFSNLEAYKNPKAKYIGAIIGRSANRIAKGKFAINETHYNLSINSGENHSHGGIHGFHNVVWDANQISNSEILFSRTSPDLEEGYPGNLKVTTKYTLTNTNELKIEYAATTDKPTIVNLTNHSFFNLSGEGNGTVNDHVLTINANYYTPLDANLIPRGEIASVKETPFDFTSKKIIGKDLYSKNEQLIFTGGYDQNYVLNKTPKNKEGLVFAAKIYHPTNGRTLEVYTNEPGLQFYESNFFDGSLIGKSGKPYVFRGAFCLETQHFPDAPNQVNFPSTLLKPGETFKSICVYKFGVAK